MEDKTFLHTNLKFLRIKKGLTQKQLADNLNKDYTSIGKWELGTRSPMMIDVVKIANYFNVSLNDLIFSDMRIINENLQETNIQQVKNTINNLPNDQIMEEDKKSLISIIDSLHHRAINEEKDK